MTRRSTLLLLLALLVSASVFAMNARYTSGLNGISVTQANTNTPFLDNHSGGTGLAFNALYLSVCSRSTSANTCHFDLDGVATTADWRLAPGACIPVVYSQKLGGDGWSNIGVICAGGETATFDIMAGR